MTLTVLNAGLARFALVVWCHEVISIDMENAYPCMYTYGNRCQFNGPAQL